MMTNIGFVTSVLHGYFHLNCKCILIPTSYIIRMSVSGTVKLLFRHAGSFCIPCLPPNIAPAFPWKQLVWTNMFGHCQFEVSDEESSQFKAYHFLFSHVGVRGCAEPELSHPLWNSYKRALRNTDPRLLTGPWVMVFPQPLR